MFQVRSQDQVHAATSEISLAGADEIVCEEQARDEPLSCCRYECGNVEETFVRPSTKVLTCVFISVRLRTTLRIEVDNRTGFDADC